MDKQFYPTIYNGCDYLSMLGLKLNHISKRGPRNNSRCIYLTAFPEQTQQCKPLDHSWREEDIPSFSPLVERRVNPIICITCVDLLSLWWHQPWCTQSRIFWYERTFLACVYFSTECQTLKCDRKKYCYFEVYETLSEMFVNINALLKNVISKHLESVKLAVYWNLS